MKKFRHELEIMQTEIEELEKILVWFVNRFVKHGHGAVNDSTMTGRGLYEIELKNMLIEKKEKIEKMRKRLNAR